MVNNEKQVEILRRIKELLGDQVDYLILEDMRQLSVWAQVVAYNEDYGLHEGRYAKPYEMMAKITTKYPQLKILMSEYVEASAAAYRHDKAAGSYIDGTGETWLTWCCKTFGETPAYPTNI